MRILAPLAIAGVLSAFPASAQEIPQADNAWYAAGQATLLDRLGLSEIKGRAKNVILMISDGNGVGSNYATRLFIGQQAGGYGDEFVLPYEAFPNLALTKTYTVNAQTPDSAGTGTAIQSGVKTRSGVIGVDETTIRGDCATFAPVKTIGDLFAEQGRSVGYVSTARITHATPASGYAKSVDRTWEDPSRMPADCVVQKDIASQLLDRMRAGDVDLALGGGRRHFFPKADDIRDEEGKKGRRTDGRDLIAEAKAAGMQYVWNDETFAALDLSQGPILGLFAPSHMKYEHDRTGEPSLAEMTAAAIEALSANEAGFFLQVEAGRVDHAHHEGNLYRALSDGAAFAAAVAKAAAMTDPSDTLLIVTADHSHALGFNGYCGRGAPITGLCYDIDPAGVAHLGAPLTADDGKPYTVAGYLNGPGSVLTEEEFFSGERPDLTEQEAMDPDYRQQALVPRGGETHTGEDVAIYARGPWAHLFSGTVEQNYIFHVMNYAANR